MADTEYYDPVSGVSSSTGNFTNIGTFGNGNGTGTLSSEGSTSNLPTSNLGGVVGANDPLAALNRPAALTTFTDMRYPKNILDNGYASERPHAVRFFINEAILQSQVSKTPMNYTGIQGQATLSGGEVGATVAAGYFGGKYGAELGAFLGKNGGIYGTLVGAGIGAVAGGVVSASVTAAIVNNTSVLNITPPQTRVPASITLYMPDTVNMTYQLGYQEDNMSDYAIPYYGSLGENLLKKMGFGDKDSTNVSTDASGWAQLFALFRSSAQDKVPIDALLKGQGVAINPQVQLLFKAVGLREFQMEFMFSPKNSQESLAIRDIVQTFKYYAAPVVGGTANGGRSTGLFFGVPATFNIQYLNGGGVNDYSSGGFLNKIGECVLENVNVDYAPNGYSTFRDGAPTQVRLTLQFKETDIVDRSKVQQGY